MIQREAGMKISWGLIKLQSRMRSEGLSIISRAGEDWESKSFGSHSQRKTLKKVSFFLKQYRGKKEINVLFSY